MKTPAGPATPIAVGTPKPATTAAVPTQPGRSPSRRTLTLLAVLAALSVTAAVVVWSVPLGRKGTAPRSNPPAVGAGRRGERVRAAGGPERRRRAGDACRRGTGAVAARDRGSGGRASDRRRHLADAPARDTRRRPPAEERRRLGDRPRSPSPRRGPALIG
jgi:hypothetical protein